MVQYEIDDTQSEADSVSERVVMATAAACDVDPIELPPLYNVIDPDALDALFDQKNTGRKRSRGRVVFMFNDCEVIVHSDGSVDTAAPGANAQTPQAGDGLSGIDGTESVSEQQ